MVKMEKIQYRSLKYVHHDFKSTYTELRSYSNKKLLYENRLLIILFEVYRCIMKLNPIYLHTLFTTSTNLHNTRGKLKLNQSIYNYVKYGKNNFSYNGAILWNMLSDDLRCLDKFNDFKCMLNLWEVPQCSCSYCNICMLKQL